MAIAPVLVVDDDADIRETLRELLEDHGYEVEFAVDGEAALDQVAAVSPCVILLDMMMPRMNGAEFLEEARRRGIDLRVIVMTANPQTAPRGSVTVLSKPIDVSRLLAAVAQACRP